MIALLTVMVWADRKFPAAGRPATTASGAASDASLPSVAIKDLNDNEISLSQHKGLVVLVERYETSQ